MKSPALLALLFFAAGVSHAEPVDVLLAAANDAELQPLIRQLESPHTETRAAWQFWTGTLARQTGRAHPHGGRPAQRRGRHHPGHSPLRARSSSSPSARRAPHDPALQPGDLVVSEKFAAFDGRPLAGAAPRRRRQPAGRGNACPTCSPRLARRKRPPTLSPRTPARWRSQKNSRMYPAIWSSACSARRTSLTPRPTGSRGCMKNGARAARTANPLTSPAARSCLACRSSACASSSAWTRRAGLPGGKAP